jgi:site-specific DNA-methyltransferase (adenine-specific)
MTTPYYTDESITLYHGDCREITAWLEADVLVTDPPYGIGYVSNMNRDRRNSKLGRPVAADDGTDTRDHALALWGDRPALVFGRWDAPRPTAVRARLVWDKGNSAGMGDLRLPWGRSDEEVYVLGVGFIGKRTGSVIRAQMLMSGDHERPDHPTPKPLGLMDQLVAKCPPGSVADPFAGSGTTLVAAKRAGRHAIGVEIDERYCEITARRLDQGVLDFGAVS